MTWQLLVKAALVVGPSAIVFLFWLQRPRKKLPPAVRISPELLEQYRGEIVWNAFQKPKQKLREGQSRRPL